MRQQIFHHPAFAGALGMLLWLILWITPHAWLWCGLLFDGCAIPLIFAGLQHYHNPACFDGPVSGFVLSALATGGVLGILHV